MSRKYRRVNCHLVVSRILVPHDGTEMSDRALEKATEFARALKADIIIAHIVDSRFVPPSATLSYISDRTSLEGAKTELVEILKSGAEQMLKEKMAKIKAEGIGVDFILGVGSPADEIVSIARSTESDLIVMGSRQLKSNIIASLGSVARKVLDTAHCPVMIIR
jgi:nucleotide-binding universal stress UspA family protein